MASQRRKTKTRRYKMWLFFWKWRVRLADWYRPARLNVMARMGRPVPNTTLDIHKGYVNLNLELRLGGKPDGKISAR